MQSRTLRKGSKKQIGNCWDEKESRKSFSLEESGLRKVKIENCKGQNAKCKVQIAKLKMDSRLRGNDRKKERRLRKRPFGRLRVRVLVVSGSGFDGIFNDSG
jgi:hypothetical protein